MRTRITPNTDTFYVVEVNFLSKNLHEPKSYPNEYVSIEYNAATVTKTKYDKFESAVIQSNICG